MCTISTEISYPPDQNDKFTHTVYIDVKWSLNGTYGVFTLYTPEEEYDPPLEYTVTDGILDTVTDGILDFRRFLKGDGSFVSEMSNNLCKMTYRDSCLTINIHEPCRSSAMDDSESFVAEEEESFVVEEWSDCDSDTEDDGGASDYDLDEESSNVRCSDIKYMPLDSDLGRLLFETTIPDPEGLFLQTLRSEIETALAKIPEEYKPLLKLVVQ